MYNTFYWLSKGRNDPDLEVMSFGVTLASIPNSRNICHVLELCQFGDFYPGAVTPEGRLRREEALKGEIAEDPSSFHGFGRSPGEGNGNPL